MKTLLKIIAAATAFGLTPVAAMAQEAPPQQPAVEVGAAPQQEATPAPAQPEEVGRPPLASGGERPTDEQVAEATYTSQLVPEPGIGQPDGRARLQDQFTPIGEEALWFHNDILMPAITLISIFVLILLVWVIVRYRRRANPEPSRTTHNTLLEVVWTLVPVLILVVIAVPSIKLLARQYSPPAADLTVKVIGNQWYWTYEYPDHGGFQLISNMLPDDEAAARGEPRLLAVDERLVVPAGATVKVIVTSADVIHSWGVPAFWVKMDAVPGRLNETWFKVDRPGLYYGQCYELCGARHAYMPIAVEVVPPAQFAAWVASKGGTMPGQVAPDSPDATPVLLEGAQGEGPNGLTVTDPQETAPPAPGAIDATATPPVSTQGATNTRRSGNQ
jgi:cytochrome c oxidase subunit II